MNCLERYFLAGLLLLCTVCFGCAKKPPETMSAGGTLTFNGQPLANAEVRFFPMEPGLDGNYVASGVTDQDGKFTLRLVGKQESSVCVGKHQVIVMEGPLPAEARGDSEQAQTAALNYMKSLKNRPIPIKYANLASSPLTVEIVAGQTEYKLSL